MATDKDRVEQIVAAGNAAVRSAVNNAFSRSGGGSIGRVALGLDNFTNLVAKATAAAIRELSSSNLKDSRFPYFSGYSVPMPITDQIDVLRGYWPQLNPDKALRYVGETLPKLSPPDWTEGAFVLIAPGFFSDKYNEEVAELFKALGKDREGNFVNFPVDLNLKSLRQCDATTVAWSRILKEQSDSDLIILPGAQFGAKRRKDSASQIRATYAPGEFGIGTRDCATMLLCCTNRLENFDDLWIQCPGDEFSRDADGVYSDVPDFNFVGGLRFYCALATTPNLYSPSGSVTGWYQL